MAKHEQALERLKKGNADFAAGKIDPQKYADLQQRADLVRGQKPFAVILGCSDSRVPADMVFDQGPGSLFVVRVAGNVASRSAIGSIEYAVEVLGSRLVVVMGHAKCGAVQATLDRLTTDWAHPSPNLSSIVDRIQPALGSVRLNNKSAAGLLDNAVRANVEHSVEQMRRDSEVLAEFEKSKGLRIVGSHYDLKTGLVEFFED